MIWRPGSRPRLRLHSARRTTTPRGEGAIRTVLAGYRHWVVSESRRSRGGVGLVHAGGVRGWLLRVPSANGPACNPAGRIIGIGRATRAWGDRGIEPGGVGHRSHDAQGLASVVHVAEAQSGAILKFGKHIRVFGCILLAAGLALILEYQIGVYREHGISELQQTMSLRNLSYYRGVAVVLMPGAAVIVLGQWLVARRQRRPRCPSYLSDFMLRR
jgi:hypothetical protein